MGIELLRLCQQLQSEKDGIDRPGLEEFDKTKVHDGFAMDINTAVTNMSALYKLIPMMLQLSALGRKLEAEGKVKVLHGDDYSPIALKFEIVRETCRERVGTYV